MKKPIKVLATIGLSYCGSTLLNLMLDSHPEIYGVGEAHWLLRDWEKKSVNNYAKPRCVTCGFECAYWTEDALKNAPKTGFYSYVAEMFNTNVIVDTSKQLWWFH